MKVILFANTDWYLFNFRLPLILTLQNKGYDILLISPSGPYVQEFYKLGLKWVNFPLERSGTNPFKEVWTILRLVHIYFREKPELVHHFTVKCVLYGSTASLILRIKKVINSVTGLGFAFIEGNGSRNFLRVLVQRFYKLVLNKTWIIFQNSADQFFFKENNLTEGSKEIIIPGSGVDMQRFIPHPKSNKIPIVILPARLLWDKGIGEFVEAARILTKEKVKARFVLAGEIDPDNPSGILPEKISEWEAEGMIEYWGWRDDMLAVYDQADIVCLPSYREGLSKTLVEAAACGIPVITCDVPGCRDAIIPGISGLLVPPRDGLLLSIAIRELIDNPREREKMGTRGRKLAEEKFSNEVVIQKTLNFYQRVLNDIQER